MVGKALALGLHRISVLSASGFSRPALRKLVDNSSLIDGVLLRSPREGEWPLTTSGPPVLALPDSPAALMFPMSGLAYCQAVSGSPIAMLLYSEFVTSWGSGLATFTLPVRQQVVAGYKALVIPRLYFIRGVPRELQIAHNLKPGTFEMAGVRTSSDGPEVPLESAPPPSGA